MEEAKTRESLGKKTFRKGGSSKEGGWGLFIIRRNMSQGGSFVVSPIWKDLE